MRWTYQFLHKIDVCASQFPEWKKPLNVWRDRFSADHEDPDLDAREVTDGNGMTVWHYPIPDTPLIAVVLIEKPNPHEGPNRYIRLHKIEV